MFLCIRLRNIISNTVYIECCHTIGFQKTSLFNGNYGKAYFAFERRWTASSIVESQPQQQLSFVQPAIPPEADPFEINEETGGISDTIRNLIGRFRRQAPQDHYTLSQSNVRMDPPQPFCDSNDQTKVDAFASTDIYIKHCDLRKDGASMQSLSQVDASRQSSPLSYWQFAKTLGSVQTGFSPGISMEDYEKGCRTLKL